MKTRIWCRIIDCGDGSAAASFFRTREDAERDMKNCLDLNLEDGWAEDCIQNVDLEFDEDGNFLNPDKVTEKEDFE